MKGILALILFLLIGSSCTTVVFINRTFPAELVLEEKPVKIVFSNQFDYRSNQGIKDKHEEAYRVGIEEFGKSLENDSLIKNPVVFFVVDTTGSVHSTDQTFEVDLEKSEIEQLCSQNNAGYLLSLDSLLLHFDWEVIREEDSTDGSVSKTKEFYVSGDYYVTLYDSVGGMIQKTHLEKTQHYSSRPTLGSLITINPNLDNAKKKIVKVADEAGFEYLSMFYPVKEENSPRVLYANKEFEETNSLIKQGQYDRAIELLEKMINTLKPKLADKAQNNLNVAMELKGSN